MSNGSEEKTPEQIAEEETKRQEVVNALDAMMHGLGDTGPAVAMDDDDDGLPEVLLSPGESESVAEMREEEEAPEEEAEEEPEEEEEEEPEEEESEESEEREEEEPEEEEEPRKGRKESEIESLRRELVEQRKAMDRILQSGQVQQMPEEAAAGTEQEKEELQLLDFIGSDEDYDKIMGDRQSLNILANRIYYNALQAAQRSLPVVAQSVVEQSFHLRAITEDFFKRNNDLLPFREYVGSVVNQEVQKDPNRDVGEILNEAAKIARKSLRLKTANKKVKRDRGRRDAAKSSFPSKSGSRPSRKADSRTDLQREIDEL